jgi:hypothetical protein
MSNQQTCVSCGMPLRAPQDHALGDPAREYCSHCANPDGALKTFDQVHAGMTQFLQRTQGIDPAVAGDMARQMMANLPAWKKKG